MTVYGSGALEKNMEPLSNLSVLALSDRDTSNEPEGGIWENLLNAAVGGNHMVVDFARQPSGLYVVKGTGPGYLGFSGFSQLGGAGGSITGEPVISALVVEPSARLGVGPLGGFGKKLTVTVTGTGYVADAHNIQAVRSTDNLPLYRYREWREGDLLNSNTWQFNAINEKIVKYWETLPPEQKQVRPRLLEQSGELTITAHTLARLREWNYETEVPFSIALAWRGEGNPILSEPYPASPMRKALEQELPGFPNGPKEPWELPLSATPFGVACTLGEFNTLTYNWSVTITLYTPPLVFQEAKEQQEKEEEKRTKEEKERGEKEGKEGEKRHEEEEKRKEEREKQEHEREKEREGREEPPGEGEGFEGATTPAGTAVGVAPSVATVGEGLWPPVVTP